MKKIYTLVHPSPMTHFCKHADDKVADCSFIRKMRCISVYSQFTSVAVQDVLRATVSVPGTTSVPSDPSWWKHSTQWVFSPLVPASQAAMHCLCFSHSCIFSQSAEGSICIMFEGPDANRTTLGDSLLVWPTSTHFYPVKSFVA